MAHFFHIKQDNYERSKCSFTLIGAPDFHIKPDNYEQSKCSSTLIGALYLH